MPNIDRFESMFRAAQREVFQHRAIEIASVLVVTDRDEQGAKSFGDNVRGFLKILSVDNAIAWRDVNGAEFHTAGELLELIDSTKPGLICTYRNLHSGAWKLPYSLGDHLDLLTQHTSVPVMVLPHPAAQRSADHALKTTMRVMAITDHLAGDQHLVNCAVRFTAEGGTLWLTHVEDEATFERYIDAISKIPDIETQSAREAILHQLLKEPHDYIRSCREVLEAHKLPLKLEEIVGMGHHLSDYRRLIEEHQVDLLVLNTKDEGQLAMHGVAYALTVELRRIPLLML